MDLTDIARSLGQIETKVDAYHGEVVNMATAINGIEHRCNKRGWICRGLVGGASAIGALIWAGLKGLWAGKPVA